jgi:hypothetical protein
MAVVVLPEAAEIAVPEESSEVMDRPDKLRLETLQRDTPKSLCLALIVVLLEIMIYRWCQERVGGNGLRSSNQPSRRWSRIMQKPRGLASPDEGSGLD